MTQPVIEAMTARYFLQRGYVVWPDLEIDDGANGDIDIMACNANEVVIAECKDQYTDDVETAISQMNRAFDYVKSDRCVHAPLFSGGLRITRMLVAPIEELQKKQDLQGFYERLDDNNIELLDADRVILGVIRTERALLKRRQGPKGPRGRYGKQPDTILNLIKWMVYRGWLNV
jgi:hypothetical protein